MPRVSGVAWMSGKGVFIPVMTQRVGSYSAQEEVVSQTRTRTRRTPGCERIAGVAAGGVGGERLRGVVENRAGHQFGGRVLVFKADHARRRSGS